MANGKSKINNKGSKSINVCPYTTGFILMIERGRKGEREREREMGLHSMHISDDLVVPTSV